MAGNISYTARLNTAAVSNYRSAMVQGITTKTLSNFGGYRQSLVGDEADTSPTQGFDGKATVLTSPSNAQRVRSSDASFLTASSFLSSRTFASANSETRTEPETTAKSLSPAIKQSTWAAVSRLSNPISTGSADKPWILETSVMTHQITITKTMAQAGTASVDSTPPDSTAETHSTPVLWSRPTPVVSTSMDFTAPAIVTVTQYTSTSSRSSASGSHYSVVSLESLQAATSVIQTSRSSIRKTATSSYNSVLLLSSTRPLHSSSWSSFVTKIDSSLSLSSNIPLLPASRQTGARFSEAAVKTSGAGPSKGTPTIDRIPTYSPFMHTSAAVILPDPAKFRSSMIHENMNIPIHTATSSDSTAAPVTQAPTSDVTTSFGPHPDSGSSGWTRQTTSNAFGLTNFATATSDGQSSVGSGEFWTSTVTSTASVIVPNHDPFTANADAVSTEKQKKTTVGVTVGAVTTGMAFIVIVFCFASRRRRRAYSFRRAASDSGSENTLDFRCAGLGAATQLSETQKLH